METKMLQNSASAQKLLECEGDVRRDPVLRLLSLKARIKSLIY